MRYAYGVATALLLGGTAFSLATGPVGAQTAQNAPAALAPRGAPQSFADLVERLQPAVVNISTKQKITVKQQVDPLEQLFRQFGAPVPEQQGGPRTREAGSLGSGFIISPDGYIVTNNHLIQGLNGTGTVDQVTVTLTNRKEYPAKIVGRDELADLALLKINARDLPFVRWGDSTKARVGDWVLAIGDPYGIGSTVTAGIISALHRVTGASNASSAAYDRYIQTDAAINMGNSGGPMFDLNGNVIGINSALISPTGTNVGIGLAIPAEAAKPVIDALRRGEKPQRGYLGVGLQQVDDEDLAASLGIQKGRGEIVRTVQPGEPAAKAGLKQQDVIVAVNGQPVTPEQSVSYLVANLPVGSRVPVEVVRNGRHITVPVTIALRPTQEQLEKQLGGGNDSATPQGPHGAGGESLGLSLQPMNARIAQALNVPPGTGGVVVTAVDPDSDAAQKGLQQGDIILAVQGQRVSTPAQVIAGVNAAKQAGRRSVLLMVKRGTSPEAFVGIDISGG